MLIFNIFVVPSSFRLHRSMRRISVPLVRHPQGSELLRLHWRSDQLLQEGPLDRKILSKCALTMMMMMMIVVVVVVAAVDVVVSCEGLLSLSHFTLFSPHTCHYRIFCVHALGILVLWMKTRALMFRGRLDSPEHPPKSTSREVCLISCFLCLRICIRLYAPFNGFAVERCALCVTRVVGIWQGKLMLYLCGNDRSDNGGLVGGALGGLPRADYGHHAPVSQARRGLDCRMPLLQQSEWGIALPLLSPRTPQAESTTLVFSPPVGGVSGFLSRRVVEPFLLSSVVTGYGSFFSRLLHIWEIS